MGEFSDSSVQRISRVVRQVEQAPKNSRSRRARWFGGPWTIQRFAELTDKLEGGPGKYATASWVTLHTTADDPDTPDTDETDAAWISDGSFKAYAPPLMPDTVELAYGTYVIVSWMQGHWYVTAAECP